MPLIETDLADRIGTIVMNNAERRNAFDAQMVAQIEAAFLRFRDLRARAVVLRAQPGAKVWSAGYDISELPEGRREPLGWGDALRVLVRAIQQFPAPVIALVEGSVWGGACEVALACDIIVCAPTTTFAITPAKLGVPYNLGGLTTLLRMIPQAVAREMLFTAQPIDAGRAWVLGIVNHVKPADEIETFVYAVARQIAANAPLTIAVMKEEMRLLEGARAMSPETFEHMQGLRRTVYDSQDYREGLAAFREKRKPEFTGS